MLPAMTISGNTTEGTKMVVTNGKVQAVRLVICPTRPGVDIYAGPRGNTYEGVIFAHYDLSSQDSHK